MPDRTEGPDRLPVWCCSPVSTVGLSCGRRSVAARGRRRP